jgi:hypothetical protein
VTAAEEAKFSDILSGLSKPIPEFYKAGRDAHAVGKAFHEGPRPLGSAEALSWRFGWNDSSLAKMRS